MVRLLGGLVFAAFAIVLCVRGVAHAQPFPQTYPNQVIIGPAEPPPPSKPSCATLEEARQILEDVRRRGGNPEGVDINYCTPEELREIERTQGQQPPLPGQDCGSRDVAVTGWGQDWTAINLSTLLTLTDGRGNASNHAGYLEVSVDPGLASFEININGAWARFGPGERRTIQIGGPYSRYDTTIRWCRRP